jgi:hypothetical protein
MYFHIFSIPSSTDTTMKSLSGVSSTTPFMLVMAVIPPNRTFTVALPHNPHAPHQNFKLAPAEP